METWALLLLLMPFAALAAEPAPKPYIMWDDRHATIEYTEDITDQCFMVNIIPGKHTMYNTSELVHRTCHALKLSERGADNKTVKQGEYVWHTELNRSGVVLRQLINQVELTESNYADLYRLLNWRPYDLLKLFGYPDNFEYGAWLAMKHKHLKCNNEDGLELFACGEVNKKRRKGVLKMIMPLGSFSKRGTIYKYRNISQWAVKVGNETISADTCKPLVKEGESTLLHFGNFQKTLVQCKVSRGTKCSYANYENCEQLVVFTPNQTFSRHLDTEIILVAANVEKFELVMQEKHEVRDMDNSKHIFMVCMPKDYIVVNNVRIYGNASYSDFVFAIPGSPENLTVTHEDLDKLIALHGNNPEFIEHRKLLKPREEDHTVKYILLGVLIVLFAAIMCSIIAPWYLYRNPRRPARAERAVRFANNECEILD